MLSEKRQTNTVWYHLYVKLKKKIQQSSEYIKKKLTHRNREKLVLTSGEWRKGNIGVRKWEIQIIGYKISSRM